MITEGEAAILLETTQRAFRNQSQSKLVLYYTKTYYTEWFYFTTEKNVLYWPRMASLWITSEASDLKEAIRGQYYTFFEAVK